MHFAWSQNEAEDRTKGHHPRVPDLQVDTFQPVTVKHCLDSTIDQRFDVAQFRLPLSTGPTGIHPHATPQAKHCCHQEKRRWFSAW
jgi:hypothetical protein